MKTALAQLNRLEIEDHRYAASCAMSKRLRVVAACHARIDETRGVTHTGVIA